MRQKILAWFLKGVIIGAQKDKLNLRTRVVMWIAKRKVNKIMDGKVWYKSKTLWFNALTGVVGILTALVKDGGLNPQTVGYIGTAVGLVNIGLRLLTDQPIEGRES